MVILTRRFQTLPILSLTVDKENTNTRLTTSQSVMVEIKKNDSRSMCSGLGTSAPATELT